MSYPAAPWSPDPDPAGVPAYVDAHGGSPRLAGRFPADALLLGLVRTESAEDWNAVAQIRASVAEWPPPCGWLGGRLEIRATPRLAAVASSAHRASSSSSRAAR
ncbi:MAG: hypothetical protein LC799_01345 [Actinobacteria bacterium]|nr:hypothetical protein [Actinomycetota bacterium]